MVAVPADYSSSGIGVLPLDDTPAPPLLTGNLLGSDPALATSAGRHFFVARDRDTIFEMDACGRGIGQWSARGPMDTQCSAIGGECVDPQDVAVAPDGSLWVARFNTPSLLVIPQGAGAMPAAIDLSSFDADGDGNPEMSSVRVVSGKAFVSLERITKQPSGDYLAQQPSQVVVLDTSSHAVLTTITLAGRNPFGLMTESGGSLWLADLGNITDATETDAGIEVLDTQALTSKLVLTKPQLGGSPIDVAVQGSCGAAVIADPTLVSSTSLVSFGTDGSSPVTVAIPPTGGFDLRGLLWTPGGTLLVADRRGPPYLVHTFSVGAACALTPGRDLVVPSMPALAFAN